MSYIPTNWQTGDVITAEKLNHLEGGVVGTESYYIKIRFRYTGESDPETGEEINSGTVRTNIPNVTTKTSLHDALIDLIDDEDNANMIYVCFSDDPEDPSTAEKPVKFVNTPRYLGYNGGEDTTVRIDGTIGLEEYYFVIGVISGGGTYAFDMYYPDTYHHLNGLTIINEA